MKILCVGSCMYDETFLVDCFIKENTKNKSEVKKECGGGTAANIACLLGKWGMEVYFAGIIGNDYYGNKIKDEFEKYNVNTKYLKMSNNFSTATSTIIVNKKNGSRTVLSYKPDNMKLDDLELDFIPDIIIIDGQEYEISKKILKKFPNSISIIDAGRVNNETLELSHLVDFLICSSEFAQKITNIDINYENIETISNIYNKLKKLFNNEIIITLGEKGVLYKKDNKIKIMKSISVNAVDTTGAGDVFHGAFAYGIATKMNLENTLKLCNVAAGLAVTKIGGRISIPSKAEVKAKLDEYR